MGWVRHDDCFSQHPKVLGLSDKAYRLHFCALEHCARNLTDGVITRDSLPLIGANAKLSRPLTTAKTLVKVGLWNTLTRGEWEINDYLTYNPSKEKVLETRTRAAERMKRVRGERSGEHHANSSGERSGRSSRSPSHRDGSTKRQYSHPENGHSKLTKDTLAHYVRVAGFEYPDLDLREDLVNRGASEADLEWLMALAEEQRKGATPERASGG